MIKFSQYLMEKDDRVDVIDLVKKNTKIISNWDKIPADVQKVLMGAEKWDMLSSGEFVAYNNRKAIYVAPYNGPDKGTIEVEVKHGEIRESVGSKEYGRLSKEIKSCKAEDYDRLEAEIQKLFKARKLTGQEMDELDAELYRKHKR